MMRDIPDVTGARMPLAGMRDFARHVANIEQLAGRVSEVIEFEPLRPEDTRIVAYIRREDGAVLTVYRWS